MSTAYPTPWTFEAEDECEDTPIRAANGEYVLVRDSGAYPPDLETCREIVDAVNERDRLRDELTSKVQNYEDVIAYHQRTEEYLRGLVKRLITVREKVFWRKDEKTGMTYETCLMDEDEARKTIEEAKAAIKEDGE